MKQLMYISHAGTAGQVRYWADALQAVSTAMQSAVSSQTPILRSRLDGVKVARQDDVDRMRARTAPWEKVLADLNTASDYEVEHPDQGWWTIEGWKQDVVRRLPWMSEG